MRQVRFPLPAGTKLRSYEWSSRSFAALPFIGNIELSSTREQPDARVKRLPLLEQH